MTETTTQVEWMPDAPLMLSIIQASFLIGVSPRTTKRLIARRELVARKVGSRTLIPRSSIESFLKRNHETGEHRERKDEQD